MTPDEITKMLGGTTSLLEKEEEDTYPDEIERRFGKQQQQTTMSAEDITKMLGGTTSVAKEPDVQAQQNSADEITKMLGGVTQTPRDAAQQAAEKIIERNLKDEASIKEGILPVYQKRMEAMADRGTPSIFDIEFGGMAPALGMEVSPAIDPSIEKVKLPETTWKEFTQDKTNKKIMADYAVARYGKAGRQKEGETDEEYANRVAGNMRFSLYNTIVGGAGELFWLKNASEEDKKKASLMWQLWDTIPSWYEEGGQPGMAPVVQGVGYAATDPLNYVGLGVGKASALMIARGLIQDNVKTKVKTGLVVAGISGAIGAGANAQQQEIEIQTGRRDRKSVEEMVLAAGFNSLFDLGEAAFVTRGKIKTTKEQLAEVLDTIPELPKDTKTEAFKTILTKDIDDTVKEYDKLNKEYDKLQGRKTLDVVSEPTGLTESQVRKDVFRRAIDAAGYIIENDPRFRGTFDRVVKKEIRVIDAIKEVYMSLGKGIKKEGDEATSELAEFVPELDPYVYEASLVKFSLNEKEFGEVLATTAGDTGSLLAGLSRVARSIYSVGKLDKESLDVIERVWGRNNDNVVTKALSTVGDTVKAGERNWKVLVTTALPTTVSNVIGSGASLTFDAFKNLVESSLLATGKTLYNAYEIGVKGKPYEKGSVTKGLHTIFKDTFNTLVYFSNTGLAMEIADELLKYNPKIKRTVFSALQETGNEEILKAIKLMNSLNVAQDAIFRSTFFVSSVERQLRRVGMNMFSLMKENKRIPTTILKNATEDALRSTFALVPKKGIAHKFVSFFEQPGMSLFLPFPRFMVNAMSFVGRYTPVLPVAKTAIASSAVIKTGAKEAYKKVGSKVGIKSKGATKQEILEAERAGRIAVEGMAESTVALAAFLAAYQYRKENPDLKWNEARTPSGDVSDIRNLFPAAPFFIFADTYIKIEEEKIPDVSMSDIIQTFAGFKVPTGSTFAFIEGLPELFNSIIESDYGKAGKKGVETASKMISEYISGVFQPIVPFKQYLEQFIEEAQTAKDSNLVEDSDNMLSETLLNKIKNKLPVEAIQASTPEEIESALPEGFLEPLPEAVFPFREGPVYRPTSFFGSLTGVRLQPQTNRIEQELKDLNIQAYKLYPTSGIRELDRKIMQAALPYINEIVTQYMDTEVYQDYTRDQKIRNLPPILRRTVAIGRSQVIGELAAEDQKTYHMLTFNRLPEIDRRILNAAYAADNDGRSIDQDEAYDQYYNYLDALVAPKQ